MCSCAIQNDMGQTLIKPTCSHNIQKDTSVSLRRVMCLEHSNGHLYVSDYDYGIYDFDSKFKVAKHYARKGHGHGEVLGCGFFFLQPDKSIWVVNEAGHSFEKYNEGNYVGRLLYPRGFMPTSCSRFFMVEDTVFHSVINDKEKLVYSFANDTSVSKFCDFVPDIDDPDMPIKSSRHVLKTDEGFLLIGVAYPIVQTFSMTGDALAQYDLKQIPLIEETYVANITDKPNSFFILVQDCYYKNGSIFLLVATNGKQYSRNTLIELRLNGNSIECKAIYKLKSNIYSTFCITDDNRCIAFNEDESVFEEYKIDTQSSNSPQAFKKSE